MTYCKKITLLTQINNKSTLKKWNSKTLHVIMIPLSKMYCDIVLIAFNMNAIKITKTIILLFLSTPNNNL